MMPTPLRHHPRPAPARDVFLMVGIALLVCGISAFAAGFTLPMAHLVSPPGPIAVATSPAPTAAPTIPRVRLAAHDGVSAPDTGQNPLVWRREDATYGRRGFLQMAAQWQRTRQALPLFAGAAYLADIQMKSVPHLREEQKDAP